MITAPLNCDQFAETLSAFLERDVSEETRAAMEAHALQCGDCGPLLAALRELRVDATNLPELVPSRDLWSGVAARIETPVVAIGAIGATVERWNGGTRRRSHLWVGLAAAGLVAITATSTYLLTRRASVAAAPTTVATVIPSAPKPIDSTKSDTVPPFHRSTAGTAKPAQRLVSNPRPTAEQTYDDEISRLRKVVKARRSQLDTATVAVVDKNLKIIDDAIAQCRMALKKDPASAYLMQSLNQELDSKVQLLRTAAGLPTRM